MGPLRNIEFTEFQHKNPPYVPHLNMGHSCDWFYGM